MNIRAATFADAPNLFHCAVEAYMGYIPLIGRAPGPMLEDYCAGVQQHHAFVAEEDGKMLGFILLKDGAGEIMWLDAVATYPQAHGRGVGTALIRYAENYMRSQEKAVCHLYTHVKYTRTIALYQHLGFEIYERVQEYGYDRYYMKKNLRPTEQGRSVV